MKTLRITAALLLTLAAAACAGSPTGPAVEADASRAAALSEGTGLFGGGTKAP